MNDQNPASQLELTREMKIAASAEKVWALGSDFGGIGKWVDVIESVEIVKGGNNQPGTQRHLALQGGGTIDEELMLCDNGAHHYRYRIVDGVLPVSEYVSDFRVSADGSDGATVTWEGHFKRKDQGPNPAEGADDATAIAAVTGVYEGGLAGLKKVAEAG